MTTETTTHISSNVRSVPNTPSIVSAAEWAAARAQLLTKEKA
ncbi:MAG: DUF899 domain-containing protein, partial [Comamonadaceae bacterium]